MVYSRNIKLIPILRYSSLVLLFLAISAQAEIKITTNYEYKEEKLVTFDIRKSLHLHCNITHPPEKDNVLTWYKDGTPVNTESTLVGRFTMHDNNQLLEIPRTQESDAGTWKCSLDKHNVYEEFNVVANLVIRLSPNSAVVEGEKLTIHCEAFGTAPSFLWRVGETTYNESDLKGRVRLEADEKGCKNALFIYEQAILEDRGDYVCIAYNNASIWLNQAERNSTTFLRVKGKLAALWPFIGICAEVFVLCAIILIYEKRRNKQDLDESDTDQSPEQKNDQHVKDSDVRQRK